MLTPLKLISWNIAGRVRRCHEQVEMLSRRAPDIVALQEVRANALPLLKAGFDGVGLKHMVESASAAAANNRRYGVMIASRWPLEPLNDGGFTIPYKERVLSAYVEAPGGRIELHTAHVPPGNGNGWKKIDTFDGIYQRLSRSSQSHRILCGDFNSPHLERPDGTVIVFGMKIKKNGEVLCEPGHERWVAGEQSVITGLSKHDLPDVFRLLNGYVQEDFSWFVYRKGRCVSMRRFDHIFASKSLNPVSCQYIHDGREMRLSDHSAIEAVFEPSNPSYSDRRLGLSIN